MCNRLTHPPAFSLRRRRRNLTPHFRSSLNIHKCEVYMIRALPGNISGEFSEYPLDLFRVFCLGQSFIEEA